MYKNLKKTYISINKYIFIPFSSALHIHISKQFYKGLCDSDVDWMTTSRGEISLKVNTLFTSTEKCWNRGQIVERTYDWSLRLWVIARGKISRSKVVAMFKTNHTGLTTSYVVAATITIWNSRQFGKKNPHD